MLGRPQQSVKPSAQSTKNAIRGDGNCGVIAVQEGRSGKQELSFLLAGDTTSLLA